MFIPGSDSYVGGWVHKDEKNHSFFFSKGGFNLSFFWKIFLSYTKAKVKNKLISNFHLSSSLDSKVVQKFN
jgi:hypothetical protein